MKFLLAIFAQASVVCVTCFIVGVHSMAKAQNLAIQSAIIPGEHLSDWLLRNADPYADTAALQWRVEAERAPQAQLRQAVIQALQQNHHISLGAVAKEHLTDWLQSLPLTGRLTVAIADARWLQSAPTQDPILQEGHSVVLPPRPATVTVVTEFGRTCPAVHISGALVQDYLNACLATEGKEKDVDWAWVAQPDGRTSRYGIAPWSLEAQAEPAPGAWIWAPSRQANIPQTVSDNLARFLATQLPGDLTFPDKHNPAVAVQLATFVQPRSAQVTASDWGEIGLLQTPTARMASAGDVRFHVSHVAPFTRGTVMFQPLDGLEFGFRYTDVANRLYGAEIAGGQTYKDKSIDVKLRFREESANAPQIAFGLRDLGGTGLFSSEYVVANKRWGNWDASLGLGWGNLGARGNISNPLSFLGSVFNVRSAIRSRLSVSNSNSIPSSSNNH